MNSEGKNAKGFTLLEVLVALVVLGLSLITIFELFQGGLQALFASGQYTKALMRAREKLEELALEGNLVVGQHQGTFEDGLRWETQVSPYPMPQIKQGEGDTESSRLKVFELSALVFYTRMGSERSVELSTLRLVLPDTKVSEEEGKP
jgi:prepilin-type N-terminal cleavage/methylation domain-containing protein